MAIAVLTLAVMQAERLAPRHTTAVSHRLAAQTG
jgi:hypothetical protein